MVLGFVTGTWAHGALGNYDPESAVTIWRVRAAARRGELVMHYQPIVATQDGAVIALEALARWIDPKRGTVLPKCLHPADREEQAGDLGDDAAHAQHGRRRRPGVGGWTFPDRHQHLAPVILLRRELPRAISEILRDSWPRARASRPRGDGERRGGGESKADRDYREAPGHRSEHDRDRRLRCRPVLAGPTRPASDRRAKDRPRPGAAHIDHAETRAIVAAITEMGHALQLRVVGEGVEDAATQNHLAGIGCDAVQGFAIARPLPPEQLGDWLRHAGSHASSTHP